MATGRERETRAPSLAELSLLPNTYECPICYNLAQPSIRTWVEGHFVCSECLEKIDDRCPICRGPFGTHKNLMLDRLTSLLNYPCLYSFGGCDASGGLVDILEHEKKCLFRPCICPYHNFNCEWKGNSAALLTHLQAQHSELSFTKSTKLAIVLIHTNFPSPQLWMIMLYCHRFYFLITICKRKEGLRDQLNVIIQLLGSEVQSRVFKFVMTFKSSFKYSYLEAPVISMQNTVSQIQEEGLCTILEEKDMSHFSEDNNTELILTIKRKETD